MNGRKSGDKKVRHTTPATANCYDANLVTLRMASTMCLPNQRDLLQATLGEEYETEGLKVDDQEECVGKSR